MRIEIVVGSCALGRFDGIARSIGRKRVEIPVKDKLLVLLTFLAVSVSSVFATQVRPVDLAEMTERSDRIFIGRCIGIDRVHDAELNLFVTRVTFEIEQSVKGELDREVTIQLLSGSGMRQTALPDVRFREGQESVLFLYPDSGIGLTSPVGFAQGHFPILRDKQGNRQIAIRSRHTLSRTAAQLGLGEADKKRSHVEPERLLGWSQQLLGVVRGGAR